jgi:hypothetical protein
MTDPTPPEDVEVLETEPVPPPAEAAQRAQAVAKFRGRQKLAWTIAIAADALQVAMLPLFAGGLASPISDALDVVMAATMIFLLGWHIAFLPTLIAEFIPIVNLVPTWTAAVWLVTRTQKPPGEASG